MRALARSGGMLRSSSRLAFSLFESPPRTLTVATVTTERCFEALIQVPSGAISFDGPAPYSVHALEETTGRPYGFLLALGEGFIPHAWGSLRKGVICTDVSTSGLV